MKTSDLQTECGQGSAFDFLGVRRGGIRGVEMGVAGRDFTPKAIALAAFLKGDSGKIQSRETREEALIRWGRDGGSDRCTGRDMRSGQIAGIFSR